MWLFTASIVMFVGLAGLGLRAAARRERDLADAVATRRRRGRRRSVVPAALAGRCRGHGARRHARRRSRARRGSTRHPLPIAALAGVVFVAADPIGRTGAHRRRPWTGLAQCAGHVVRAERRRRRRWCWAASWRRSWWRWDRRGSGAPPAAGPAADALLAADDGVLRGRRRRDVHPYDSGPRLPGVRPAARNAAHQRPARRRGGDGGGGGVV